MPLHQKRALEIVDEMEELARTQGLEVAIARAERAADEESVELAQYALMVFLITNPEGRQIPIEPLADRQPHLVNPTAKPRDAAELEALGSTGNEIALDWYREDADANFHHEWWHVVYRAFDPRTFRKERRQGELFAYMHQQMLARYDVERLCAGLPAPVAPLTNLSGAIAEGYDPQIDGYDARPANASLARSAFASAVPNLQTWARNLGTDLVKKNPTLKNAAGQDVPATPDLIGSTLEADLGAVANDNRYGSDQAGGLHNNGHGVIAYILDPARPGQQPRGGVMRTPPVAIRDPVFYRWHRFVDDINFQSQEKQDVQAFASKPQVTLRDTLDGTKTEGRSPDVILASATKVKAAASPQAFGDTNFGGAKWNSDPATSGLATDVLTTTMKTRNINGKPAPYLDHEDFYYFIRVNNDLAAEQTVTVRVFLAPDKWLDQRRFWIELDKFQQKLKPGQNVIARSSRDSSVVRKPALHPDEPVPPPAGPRDPLCDCGWPYHLLLPRGARAGMKFRLLVIMTDWQKDKVEAEGKCGSMSYCGKKDGAYPDQQPMGYPFDRRWPKTIRQTILDMPTMAARDITIKWT